MISITNNGPHIRHHIAHIGGATLLAVIEANLKDPRAYVGDVLDAFLADAMAPASTFTSETLTRVAARVSSLLWDDLHYRRTIGAVVFAAVLFTPEQVEVCTAGDMRVHVVRADKSVEHVTRDHNAVSDPQEGVEYARIQHVPGFLENVLTRVLPSSNGGKPPEYLRWQLSQGSTVYVCSSRVHIYRDPATYLPLLRANNGTVAGVPELGFVAIISPIADPTSQ